jgi:outer membrane protein TolC
VYVFGTKLRQNRFTQADFDVNALNRPAPVGNFATRFSGSWMAFDSFRTQKMIRLADLMQASAATSAKAVDQRIIFNVVQAYQGVLYAERQVDVARHDLETAEAPWGLVRVKMLPFDNKSELQVVVNMPDGTPLEQTLAVI